MNYLHTPGGYNQPYGDSKYQPPSSPATYQSPVVAATAQSPATYQSPVATGQPPSYLPQTPASAPPPQVGSGLPTCTALYDYTAQAQGDLTFLQELLLKLYKEPKMPTDGGLVNTMVKPVCSLVIMCNYRLKFTAFIK